MKLKRAMEVLELPRPKISKTMKQAEVNEEVARWKEEVLKPQWRKLLREHHPDFTQDPEEKEARGLKTRDLNLAYEALGERLQLKAYVPTPEESKKCGFCEAARTPADAQYCYSCGRGYKLSNPITECPVCESTRFPAAANFCGNCGHDYRPHDPLIGRLRSAGLETSTLKRLDRNGTLKRWSTWNPLDPQLAREIRDEASKQNTFRKAFRDLM